MAYKQLTLKPAKASKAKPAAARPKPAEQKRRAELQAKIERYQQLLKQARRRYRRANLLLEEIVSDLGVHEPIEFDDGRRAIVLDCFATKITAFKPVGFDRYTIQVSK